MIRSSWTTTPHSVSRCTMQPPTAGGEGGRTSGFASALPQREASPLMAPPTCLSFPKKRKPAHPRDKNKRRCSGAPPPSLPRKQGGDEQWPPPDSAAPGESGESSSSSSGVPLGPSRDSIARLYLSTSSLNCGHHSTAQRTFCRRRPHRRVMGGRRPGSIWSGLVGAIRILPEHKHQTSHGLRVVDSLSKTAKSVARTRPSTSPFVQTVAMPKIGRDTCL